MNAVKRPSLFGLWRTDHNDRWSLHEYGDVSLHFDDQGKLTYTIHLPTKKQVMYLTYKIEGTWIVTDQPTAARVERTEFFFTADGRLALKSASTGPPTYYVRVE
jgi:hypothetical protein